MAGDSRTRHHIRFVCNIIVRWSVSHSIETPTEDRNGRKEKDIPCHFISVKLKKKKADHPKICVRHHQVDDAHFFRGFCCCGRCFFSVENRTQVASQDHRVMALFSLILCCQRRKTLDWTSSALLIEKKPLSVGVKYCAR